MYRLTVKMEERLNAIDRERCLHGYNAVSGNAGEVSDDKSNVTSSDSSAAGRQTGILRSLLSRPVYEATTEDGQDITRGSGQCQHRLRIRDHGLKKFSLKVKVNVDLYSERIVVRTSPLMHSGVDHTVLPANHTTPAFTRSSPGGATTE